LLLTGVFRQGMPRKKQVPRRAVVDNWAWRVCAHMDIGSVPHWRRQWTEPRLPIGSIECEQIDQSPRIRVVDVALDLHQEAGPDHRPEPVLGIDVGADNEGAVVEERDRHRVIGVAWEASGGRRAQPGLYEALYGYSLGAKLDDC